MIRSLLCTSLPCLGNHNRRLKASAASHPASDRPAVSVSGLTFVTSSKGRRASDFPNAGRKTPLVGSQAAGTLFFHLSHSFAGLLQTPLNRPTLCLSLKKHEQALQDHRYRFSWSSLTSFFLTKLISQWFFSPSVPSHLLGTVKNRVASHVQHIIKVLEKKKKIC